MSWLVVDDRQGRLATLWSAAQDVRRPGASEGHQASPYALCGRVRAEHTTGPVYRGAYTRPVVLTGKRYAVVLDAGINCNVAQVEA